MYIYILCTRYSPHLILKILFRKFHNLSPYDGLFMKSTVKVLVRQYSIIKFPFLTWSVRGKYLMFEFLALLLKLFSPFPCSRMVLLLYWYLKIVWTYILMFPEKPFSVTLDLTRHLHLPTRLPCCFSYTVFAFLTQIRLLLFLLLMLFPYAI